MKKNTKKDIPLSDINILPEYEKMKEPYWRSVE